VNPGVIDIVPSQADHELTHNQPGGEGPAGWAGWDAVWWAGVLPFLLGGVAAVVLLVVRRATLRSAIPLGPWMVLGTAVSLSVARLLA